MRSWFYNLVWTLMRVYFDVFYPCRVSGLENLPTEGGFVLCINHISARDPLFIASRVPRKRKLFFLAKKELFQVKFFAPFVRMLGAIPIDRGNADLNAIRASLKALRDGYGLGIFPQGTRSRDNTPTPMLSGASLIALRGGVPVIPAYIDGPYRCFHRMDVRFGAPVSLEDFGRRCDKQTLVEATRRIESAVWTLGGREVPVFAPAEAEK